MRQAKIGLYVGLVFASGVLLGVFGQRFYAASTVTAKSNTPGNKGPAGFRAQYLAEMQTRLNLTEDQFNKVAQFLDETRARMNEVSKTRIEPEIMAIRKRMEPEMNAIRDEQIQKIRAILTPEQALGYDQLRKEREERSKQKVKEAAH